MNQKKLKELIRKLVQEYQVECITLESILDMFETIDLLKVDIEGSEFEILPEAKFNDGLEFLCVEFHQPFVSPSRIEKFNKCLENLKNGDAPARAYYSLSSQEYENLSMDMAEITRYTKDILSIIKYYREYDKPKEEKEDE